jgi:hypothetical protein
VQVDNSVLGVGTALRRLGLIALVPLVFALSFASGASATTQANANYGYTGAEQTFTVPAGVTSIQVQATGAPGGSFADSGGFGDYVTSTLSVIPGEVLYVEVGGPGASVQGDDVIGGAGGFNGGAQGGSGTGDVGAGGGGATDVRTEPNSLDSRLLVAGGGGGAGATCISCGGDGGNAGQPGTTGSGGGAGGDAGTGIGGGTGGAGTIGKGDDGTLGNGGAGQTGISGDAGGGGGAGGYYGGGGGGEGSDAGGGGGGSSYSAGSATTVTTDATGTPSIVITYPIPTAAASPTQVTFTGTQPQMTMSGPQTVTVTNNGSAPLYVSGWSFSGADPGDFFVGSDTCAGAVAPVSSCQLTVRFAPQASGTRSANLLIDTNTASSPTSVPLSGTGGSLPQGPRGPQGQKGPQGARGPAGMIELVTCRQVTKKVNGRTRKVQKCTGRLVSGTVKFTVSGNGATVSRNGIAYATGVSISSGHGRRELILTGLRRALRGRYVLTLRQHRHRRVSRRRVSIVIA